MGQAALASNKAAAVAVGEPIPSSPVFALRGLYKPAMNYFIDGKPCTPDEYISWQAGIIEAITKAKLPEPKYYGGSAEEADQHEVKCAYVDGWNGCRASILSNPPAPIASTEEAVSPALSAQMLFTLMAQLELDKATLDRIIERMCRAGAEFGPAADGEPQP